MKKLTNKKNTSPEQASVLVGLLWCMALLGVVVIGLLHTSRIDLMVQKNYGDRIQAHYLAIAGIEKTKALLYRDARQRSQTGRNHSGELYDSPENFRDVHFGRGQFRIIRQGSDTEGGGLVYGVSDEESRLNVNYASFEQISNLYQMTPQIAAAILDWRDEDNQVTPGGAEAEYYESLRPPSLPRNGPLQTVRELLMVRGVSREMLYGSDKDPTRRIGTGTDARGQSDSGWADLLTVNSSVENVSGTGQERVNIQSADENTLTSVRGITSEIAKAIVAHRNQNQFESILNLLDVNAVQNQNQPGAPGNQGGNPNNPGGQPSPQGGPGPNQPVPNPSGPKVVSEDLLLSIADDITVQSGTQIPGLVNVNTAELEVLICLPGVTRAVAHSIISYRRANGFLSNVAYLLRVPGMTREIAKQLAPLVCVRSETYRILCEGRIDSSRVTHRIQETVHVGLRRVTTVAYREDDL